MVKPLMIVAADIRIKSCMSIVEIVFNKLDRFGEELI